MNAPVGHTCGGWCPPGHLNREDDECIIGSPLLGGHLSNLLAETGAGAVVRVVIGDTLWNVTAEIDSHGDVLLTPVEVSDRDLPDD